MSGSKPDSAHMINKRTGSFYTPEVLAYLITEDTMKAWFSQETGFSIGDKSLRYIDEMTRRSALATIKEISVLDPAVGDGAFLLSAAEWLLEARLSLGDTSSISLIKQQIVQDCLFGVDIIDSAAEECQRNLKEWALSESSLNSVRTNIEVGNSLVGQTSSTEPESELSKIPSQLSWVSKFPNQMTKSLPGFDVILGNPPYGNILSQVEREYIKTHYPFDVFSGRKGSWNIASQFIVRCHSLIRPRGQIALLIPNSILRVGQFSRTREFLLNHWQLWQIADEGSPFDDVTLEMVTIFSCAMKPVENQRIKIVSRRPDVHNPKSVSWKRLAQGGYFVLYQDEIFDKIRNRGKTNVLRASRGRDIPHDHVAEEASNSFNVPYATKGRSIKRYRFCESHLRYADNWFMDDSGLLDSYRSEFLIATKNLAYPRVVMKPRGVIHGGGAVRIRISHESLKPEVIGLILNSRLVRYYCTRYLTNESRLTTCLNTGIVEELPIPEPEEPDVFVSLFSTLQTLYQENPHNPEKLEQLENLADALVYDLYLGEEILQYLLEKSDLDVRCCQKIDQEISDTITQVVSNPIVQMIESYPRLQ